LILDHRKLGADFDCFFLGDGDPAKHTRRRGRYLGVHLVSGNLEQRLVGLDEVALLLKPARDCALGDALA